MVEKLTLLWIYLLHSIFFFIMEIIILVFFKTTNSIHSLEALLPEKHASFSHSHIRQ